MKTRAFWKDILLIASLLFTTVFQAAAQAPAGGGGGRGGMGVLTQEQRTKIRETIQADLTPLMQKLAAAQKEVVKAALADNASDDTVKSKVEALHKIETDVALLRLKGVKAIASTLTAEQKTQLENSPGGGYMALFGAMGGGRGGGGGRRGGNN